MKGSEGRSRDDSFRVFGLGSPAERRKKRIFLRRLRAWYRASGRHDLPWQRDRRGYAVWVSEIMLQQTTVEAVRGYYRRFLVRFPTVQSLAEADRDEVLACWAGLGYYRRAHHLHQAARIIVARHGGRMPRRAEVLSTLPGIGISTAGAIVSLAYDRPALVLDTNVRRFLGRFWAEELRRLGGSKSGLVPLARWLLPETGGRVHTQALMDMGALVCRPREPDCGACPFSKECPGPEAEASALRPKVPRPRETRVLTLLLRRDRLGRCLLVRRPPEGIWAGLWCLPEAQGFAAPPDPHPPRYLARRVHRLSHLDLDIRLVESRSPSAKTDGRTSRWVDVSRTDPDRLGLPPVVRAMVESLAAS